MSASAPSGSKAVYEPPRQSLRGQFVDAIVILVLIFGTLFATTFLSGHQDSGPADGPRVTSVKELPVTPGEAAQYQKMIDTGMADLPTIAADVAANRPDPHKYDIDVLALIGTAVLLAVYLGFVYRVSFREYREVIEERFGPRDQDEKRDS